MKLKYWPKYLANHALCYCRDMVAPAYKVEPVTADFFISMGEDCKTAMQLRRNKLRICASPLDWMKNYNLADAAELFRTRFSSYFTEIRERHAKTDDGNRAVEDTRNGMLSVHHFPRSLSLEDGQKFFRERAMRHFANTHRFMTEAERIAIVTNRTESIDSICRFLTVMKSLYKAEIIHINMRNKIEKKYEKIVLPSNSILHDYTFNNAFSLHEQVSYRGNDYEWRRILRKCRRTQKFSPTERPTNYLAEYNVSSK